MSMHSIGQLQDLFMQAVPTDHIGVHRGVPVRIWQAVTPDGSNFVLYVSAFCPLAGFVSDHVLELLAKNSFAANPDLPLPDPWQAIAFVSGQPDGIDRDNVHYDKDVLN
jgi:hypothetical protein